jgi:hypothetical protein
MSGSPTVPSLVISLIGIRVRDRAQFIWRQRFGLGRKDRALRQGLDNIGRRLLHWIATGEHCTAKQCQNGINGKPPATPTRKVREMSADIFMPQTNSASNCPYCSYSGFRFNARKLCDFIL